MTVDSVDSNSLMIPVCKYDEKTNYRACILITDNNDNSKYIITNFGTGF